MADMDFNKWEAFCKTGRIDDYLTYRGVNAAKNVTDDTAKKERNIPGSTADGREAQRNSYS